MSIINRSSIVLASNNPGKLKEFQDLLASNGFLIVPQSQFNLSAAEESGLTFVENAILKARHACKYTGLAALADDSGIEVDALHGAPGIYSARFAGEGGEDSANNLHLLELLKDVPEGERTARFQCSLVFMRHEKDPTPIICQGTWQGRILLEPKGENGFGYDPLFYVPEKSCSAAMLDQSEKTTISHRGQAMRQLLTYLSAQAG